MSSDWTTILHTLHATLVAAQEERADRDDWETVGEETQLGWVFYEREQMWAETNDWREHFGLPPVDVDMIARVERQAVGHFDYTMKYVIECAELAMGRNPLEDLP
jgi:hypothetical protein